MTATTELKLNCNFPRVQHAFGERLPFVRKQLSAAGVAAWIDGAERIYKLGRGEEPVLVFLEELPQVMAQVGEDVLAEIVEFTRKLGRSPNSKSIVPFLQTLPAAARHLESRELFGEYLELVFDTLARTSPKIHGIDSMYPSECLPEFLGSVPHLLSQISLGGLRNWVDYGVQGYPNDPDRQREYFALKSPDSLAVMQRERHGTLFSEHERKLDLYLRGLWDSEAVFMPYSLAWDEARKPIPYLDDLGLHLPDVYDDFSPPLPPGEGRGEGSSHTAPHPQPISRGERGVISGLNRYRALIAHLSAHRRWSTPQIADNFSPFQRLSIEVFEDARVEWLALQEFPGLRHLWLALHPAPKEDACPEGWSSIRHRLAMLSRALLAPQHGYQNAIILQFVERFHALMQAGPTTTRDMVQLGLDYITRTRTATDPTSKVWFEDTEVSYRDDNRLLWLFIEEGDEEVYESKPRPTEPDEQLEGNRMPPRMYPEWEYNSQHYLPDWVSLYEHLHPQGDAGKIDRLLEKHAGLAKKLKRIIDLLKPQQKVRVRYQEEGAELDLDVAIRSLIDFKSGAQPDPRINMSHKPDGRSVAVSLLLDLSASLGDVPQGCTQSKLELSQEAVSLLAWAVEQMGDPFAIGGFHSDTRHDVRYQHFKGYKEHWDDTVKSRLAAMEAGYSTRMGAALRHAGHYLSHQQADKRLLLVLTDGEPADIDVTDPRALIEDARQAVLELSTDGIYTYCINLDPKADEYVADIFGKHYTVIDNVERLPERLPQLFMSLTR
ncbi:MAG: VWA domain-containing protein [Nitrosomonadales bacterium]|nr:VWA domain-containing protein [Nitrosomonadales bacterium]